ncbi:DEAD/DEAH box helicase [Candidatus Parcubacteria bacterium]|jgi:transcription-repair coupling factor|nr:DEAD/DEAH box helicase [Candidatus Parcubacteria bacterium]
MEYRISTADSAENHTLSIFDAPLFGQKEAVLWCLENNKQVKIYSDLLRIWQKNIANDNKKIITWASGQEINLDTLISLNQSQPSIILTTYDNLESAVANFKKLEENRIDFKVGQEYNLGQTIIKLAELDLNREKEVWENNTFAVRGSILDIYQNNKILRLNFDSNILEGITEINPFTLRDDKLIKKCFVWPAKILHKQQFIKSLPENTLIVHHQNASEYFHDIYNDQIIFDPLSSKGKIFDTTPLQLSDKDKIKYLKTKNILWFSKHKNLAEKIIKENKFQAKIIDWSNGLIWPAMFETDQYTIVNDTLFFLTEEVTKKQATAQEFKPEYSIGDFVVHRDHGIAKFTDITKMKVDDLEHEYLVLSYAQNDNLFVPIELADKVEKYIGPINPKVQRLSVGNTWPQTLQKIKKHTLELANKLLTIEATRKLMTTPSISPLEIDQAAADDFPYQLTPSQSRAVKDISSDLRSLYPSDRLICGDVGFGKTEVALRAAAMAVSNGWQVAFLCPTTILAQQHYDNFVNRLEKYGINVALLTRWQNKTQVKSAIEDIKQSKIDIVIGTHRLLSKDIHIPKLQLLIIDEEQNFGVEDKEKLKKQKAHINVLTLTATPIPRTLNLALSAIKDISLITDPISNRKDIITKVHSESDEVIKKAINIELKRKGQVYFLHNRVETINFAYKKIQKLFPKKKIEVAHGQLEDKQLAKVMHNFDIGETDILVCSTIIANGLDIPNANTLIVREANKFGLSQLHQLRGRIGRSDKQAYAHFLYSAPKLTDKSSTRLSHLKFASSLGDGFKIAHKDMELRGVGQILGRAQSGRVKSIGLGMYQQLVTETIAELKGQKTKTWRDIEIKLYLDTNLPDKLYNEIPAKLKFYQTVSYMRDVSTIDKKISKATEESVKNILWLQKIKTTCQDTDIIGITNYQNRDKKFVSINFLGNIDPKKIVKLLDTNPAWKFSDNQIRIQEDFLTKNIKESIEEVINIFKA